MTIDGEQLLQTIVKNKTNNREEAEKAFALFCGHYGERATQMAVNLCEKWKRPENYAYEIVECAFQKVWLYVSFYKKRSKIKDTDRAILNWIYWILVHELTLFSQKGNCSHPEKEDLPLITSPEEFIEGFFDEYLSEEEFYAMKTELDKIISGLTPKEITIYLTYKVYQKNRQFAPPRNVLDARGTGQWHQHQLKLRV